MLMRSHKIALNPNNAQITYFKKAAGTSRFAYNWALLEWKRQYELRKENSSLPAISQTVLRKQLNAIKGEQFPWMKEVTKCAPQEAVIDLGKAFDRFFKKKARYPKLKKKGKKDSFRLSSGQFAVVENRVRIPLLGWVNMCESLRWKDAKILSATISRTADRWFISFNCQIEGEPQQPRLLKAVGVDVGVHEFAASNGARFETPRAYRKYKKKLRSAQRSLSRKQKGSSNRKKAVTKVARLHKKVADCRSNWLHQITNTLTTSFSVIGIETLNVKAMTSNFKKSRQKSGLNISILDAGFYEFRRQMEYKSEDRNVTLVEAQQFFPSTKLCNRCLAKTKLKLRLHMREWTCENCGSVNDRDLNAAKNLRDLALTAGSSSVEACGEFSTSAYFRMKVST